MPCVCEGPIGNSPQEMLANFETYHLRVQSLAAATGRMTYSQAEFRHAARLWTEFSGNSNSWKSTQKYLYMPRFVTPPHSAPYNGRAVDRGNECQSFFHVTYRGPLRHAGIPRHPKLLRA